MRHSRWSVHVTSALPVKVPGVPRRSPPSAQVACGGIASCGELGVGVRLTLSSVIAQIASSASLATPSISDPATVHRISCNGDVMSKHRRIVRFIARRDVNCLLRVHMRLSCYRVLSKYWMLLLYRARCQPSHTTSRSLCIGSSGGSATDTFPSHGASEVRLPLVDSVRGLILPSVCG